jgi:hypothetical protein
VRALLLTCPSHPHSFHHGLQSHHAIACTHRVVLRPSHRCDNDESKGFGRVIQGIWVDGVNASINSVNPKTEAAKNLLAYYAEIAKMIKGYNKISE